jgi:hypothetical protein
MMKIKIEIKDEERFIARLYELDATRDLPWDGACGSCLHWKSNNTQYGGVCSNINSDWSGLIVSAIKNDCEEHSEWRAR